MSRMAWWNYYVLQWFFIRRCRETQRVIKRFDLYEASTLMGGGIGIGGRIRESENQERRGWMLGAVPRTGWDEIHWRYLGGKPQYIWGKWKTVKPVV